MNEKPSYFSILTADVRYDERLRPNEKIMYSEITALSNKDGYCSASNTYFADLYKVGKNTVSLWVNNLKKYGYISVVLEYKENTKQVARRKIYANNTYQLNDGYPITKKKDTLSIKNEEGCHEKKGYLITKKNEENNTSFNNINKNNTSINKGDKDDSDDKNSWKKLIIDEWNRLDDNIPKLQALNPSTNRYNLMQARINQYGIEKVVQSIRSINQSAFLKGYKNDFRITFDWFVKPNNFIKVLEGNYLDKKKPIGNSDIDNEIENDFLNIKRL